MNGFKLAIQAQELVQLVAEVERTVEGHVLGEAIGRFRSLDRPGRAVR